MAEIIQEEKGKKGGKRRPKKHGTHIDMTPMVDLMCLLITFFMLTTAFSKAKVMVITMPEKDKADQPKDQPQIAAFRTLNIILSEGNKVYYYIGMADPKNPLCQLLSKLISVKMESVRSYSIRTATCSQRSPNTVTNGSQVR